MFETTYTEFIVNYHLLFMHLLIILYHQEIKLSLK